MGGSTRYPAACCVPELDEALLRRRLQQMQASGEVARIQARSARYSQ